MSTDYLPARDADFLAFSQNFSARLTASPASYSLTAADATLLAASVSGFASALTLAVDPLTKTPVATFNKDTARASLTALIRSYSRRIQASPTVTDSARVAIGLKVRDTSPTSEPAPGSRPELSLLASGGRRQTVRLRDETTPSRRGKPKGVVGALVYSCLPAEGQTPPADLEQWRCEGIATKSEFGIGYNAADVGKTAYVVAVWFNRKGETGPVSAPIVGTIAA